MPQPIPSISGESMNEIDDFGPWRMLVTNHDVTLYSDDFKHDVAITISGDFYGPQERVAYANSIMRRLSAPCSSGDSKGLANATDRGGNGPCRAFFDCCLKSGSCSK